MMKTLFNFPFRRMPKITNKSSLWVFVFKQTLKISMTSFLKPLPNTFKPTDRLLSKFQAKSSNLVLQKQSHCLSLDPSYNSARCNSIKHIQLKWIWSFRSIQCSKIYKTIIFWKRKSRPMKEKLNKWSLRIKN